MAYSASVIAYAFVQKGIEEGKFVTQMKLQKMVYFAHGYHLARYNEPLIREEFEAWKFGPVVPSIYQSYKLYGSDMIIDTGLIAKPVNEGNKPEEFPPSVLEAIDYTWQVTKKLTANNLSLWSHLEGSPWAQVYNPNYTSQVIRNDSIKEYFQMLLALPTAA